MRVLSKRLDRSQYNTQSTLMLKRVPSMRLHLFHDCAFQMLPSTPQWSQWCV